MNVDRGGALDVDVGILLLIDAGAVAITFAAFAGGTLLVALDAGLSWPYAHLAAVFAGYYGAGPVADEFGTRLREDDVVDEEDRIAALREQLVAGEIDLETFEERVELVLDEDACIVRDDLEAIDGIGPETSAAIAARFATIDDVQEADRSELEDVDGVGPATSSAILEEIGGIRS